MHARILDVMSLAVFAYHNVLVLAVWLAPEGVHIPVAEKPLSVTIPAVILPSAPERDF